MAPQEKKGEVADGAAPPITFSSFVIGLATQALMFLGAVPNPGGGEVEKDPAEAATIISVIEMLAAKTAGNLSEDEAKLIEEVLFELRMRYVNETRRSAAQEEGKG
ncbi:MAG: DUF1844 domain-containing protein [Candidatus Binatia bacterium]